MTNINIDDLTVKQVREIAAMLPETTPADLSRHVLPTTLTLPKHAWEVGKIYLIRTVTMIDTGRLVAVTDHELVLEDAAWIADTGRFADAVARAEFGEVEPFPSGRVIVGRGAVVDAVQIQSAPRTQK